jgi:rhodanese-related sulfurtransferase
MARFTSKAVKLTLLGILVSVVPATWVLAGGFEDLVSKTERYYEVKGATTLDVATAKALFDRGVPFVDVRGKYSWAKGHIPGAIHLESYKDFSKIELSRIVGKDDEVVIYSINSDAPPAPYAVAQAVFWGYKKVYYFRDGFYGWKVAGYPVAKP